MFHDLGELILFFNYSISQTCASHCREDLSLVSLLPVQEVHWTYQTCGQLFYKHRFALKNHGRYFPQLLWVVEERLERNCKRYILISIAVFLNLLYNKEISKIIIKTNNYLAKVKLSAISPLVPLLCL